MPEKRDMLVLASFEAKCFRIRGICRGGDRYTRECRKSDFLQSAVIFSQMNSV